MELKLKNGPTMLINKPLILNHATNFQAISRLNKKLNDKLGGNSDDYIISLKNSRVHSKRITKSSRNFLGLFTKPALFVDVIYKYATDSNLDYENLLTKTYPLIKSFVSNGFLEYHKESNNQTSENKHLFANKSWFHQYQIISCIQHLPDTEIYKAANKQGGEVLLKCIRTSSTYLKDCFKTELSILQKLSNPKQSFTPNYHSHYIKNDFNIMVIEWIEGISLWDVIRDKTLNIETRKKVASNILDAYNFIHKKKIFHADIHPNNIKISKNHQVTLFDFGASINIEEGISNTFSRAGILRFHEPEYASSISNSSKGTLATMESEQYQISALIYQVITGNHYIDLSYETEIALNQIIQKTPIPFSTFHIEAPNTEKVLKKALKKAPKDRFQTWDLYYSSIKYALKETIISKKKKNVSSSFDFKSYLNKFVKEYGYDSEKLNQFSINKPSCSFFHGASGIAYCFYRLSHLTKNPQLLSLADIWITLAEKNSTSKNAFVNASVGMTENDAGINSYFHRNTGIYAVNALIKSTLGYTQQSNKAIASFLNYIEKHINFSKDPHALDPSQGAGSYLFGISMLSSLKNVNTQFPLQRLHKITNSILNQYFHLLKKSCIDFPTKDGYYNGFAHGLAGSLYAILQLDQETISPYLEDILTLLSHLESEGAIGNDYAFWKVSSNKLNATVWPGWCHGTAGHILLWAAVYEKFNNKKHLELAVKAGNYLSNTLGKSNVSVCCGLGGESLAFYKLGQITNDQKWYLEGLKLAELALTKQNNFTLEDSLFQGKTGLYFLSGESLNPKKAIFPLCENPLTSLKLY